MLIFMYIFTLHFIANKLILIYQKSEISPDFTVSSRRMEVKCELQGPDESNQTIVIFDRKGNVADFIREMRRALRILPLDKVIIEYLSPLKFFFKRRNIRRMIILISK